MKKFLYLIATAAVLCTACFKDSGNDSSAASIDDIKGVWVNTSPSSQFEFSINDDGGFTRKDDYDTYTGSWTFKNGIMTLTEDGKTFDYNVRLISGKSALVLSSTSEFGVDYELYYKKGATINSGALKDGRYDAPHNGIKGEGNYDRTVSFVIKGNEMDLYIHAWGTHLKGTYTQENGYLKFNATQGWHGESNDGDWFAGEADIDFENFTFLNPSYKWVDGMRYAEDFSNFALCASEDGKDVYLSVVGLTRWAFLR